MEPKTMIALVGEQPIPILLPILKEKEIGPIDKVILVCSDRTKPVGQRLKKVLQNKFFTGYNIELLCVEPYNILKTKNELLEFISKQKINQNQIVFNLTGGTKSMALAAYSLAEQTQSPFVYFQSEGNKSQLHSYIFVEGGEIDYIAKEIPTLLNIDTYLNAYLDGYEEKPPKPTERFEKIVSDVLCPIVDEIKTSITYKGIGSGEIDLVLRCGNNIGIAEVKTGNKARSDEGIKQLSVAGEQRFLGTYAKKILIIDREYPEGNLSLAKAHQIEVIETPSFGNSESKELSDKDKEKLIAKICEILRG